MKSLRTVILLAFACACTRVAPVGEMGRPAPVFPDYADVTVPVNVAPLNFNVSDSSATAFAAILRSGSQSVTVKGRGDLISIPSSDWKSLTATLSGIDVTVCALVGGRWLSYEPFRINVSEDRIDPYIAYRLIPPGYETWGEMGIYQRCLETYDQSTVIDNSRTGTNCMNCHSFADRSPETFLFHMRASNGGTYLVKDGKVEKLNMKTVYPRWSPSGEFVAFSVNDIAQFFHSTDPNVIEVYDNESDVVVYDVVNHSLLSSPLTSDPGRFETFPAFSPDGRTLYFCSSPAVQMPQDYLRAQYSIMSVAFNPEDRSFGEELHTVYDAAGVSSASCPRLSPDGRFLLFTRLTYGQFPIWHKEADLYLIDLQSYDRGARPLAEFNSGDAESYHGWSSSGRWVVFSSRRDDGLYTKPDIGHIDADGEASKPFLLPQRNPREFYDNLMFSFNLPDFITGKVEFPSKELVRCATEEKGTDVSKK